MASRLFKDVKRDAGPSQAEVRRAKDLWVDIFQDAIVAQIDDSSVGRSAPIDLVRFAGEVADRGIEEMEKRWGKV